MIPEQQQQQQHKQQQQQQQQQQQHKQQWDMIVCAQLHFNICEEIRVKWDKKHWYDHVSKSVKTSNEGKVTILWNQQVQTDRTIPNNKQDIIIHGNKKRNRNSAHVECESKSDTNNNIGNWNNFKITQKTPEQWTRKPRN